MRNDPRALMNPRRSTESHRVQGRGEDKKEGERTPLSAVGIHQAHRKPPSFLQSILQQSLQPCGTIH